jgi:hypothetical protein
MSTVASDHKNSGLPFSNPDKSNLKIRAIKFAAFWQIAKNN